MTIEQTLSIIKPDAVQRNIVGPIITLIEGYGLKIVNIKMTRLTTDQAKIFYKIHNGKPYFESLVEYITSGDIIVLKLEGEDAVNRYREIMGTTDPEQAKNGTIRKKYAQSMQKNSVHGSDSIENAKIEINFFFKE